MRKIKFVGFIVILLLIGSLSGCLKDSGKNGDQNNSDNKTPEDFTFMMLDGAEKNLSAYRGKVVILDLWATWCGPCQVMMKELSKIYDDYSRDVLEILSINIDPNEGLGLIQEFETWFKGYYGIELEWVLGNDINGVISKKYIKVGYIPTVCIFDQDGGLQFRKESVCGYSQIPEGYPTDTPLLAPIINSLL